MTGQLALDVRGAPSEAPVGSPTRADEDVVYRTRSGHEVTVADVRWRFLAKVEPAPSGCWMWTASCTGGHGMAYGQFPIPGVCVSAHRASWFLFHGDLPKVVRHRCDTPLCVNPDHLEGGTQADNVRDMVERGRVRNQSSPPKPRTYQPQRKDTHGNARLTWEAVRDIRASAALGEPHGSIAARHRISKSNVSYIARGRGWKAA